MKLKRSFYLQPGLEGAKSLLGKYLVVNSKRGKIVETEAYIGTNDKASHAYKGKKTERNKAEYFAGGHIYIYLVYGMYFQFNISFFKEGVPECVLIRAVDTEEGLFNGPGKLCRFFSLDKSFYGEDLTKSKRIWLEEGEKPSKIVETARIGIDYAGPYWSRRKWRFLIKEYRRFLK